MPANLNGINNAKIEKSIAALNERIKKSLEGTEKSIEAMQEKMLAFQSLSKVEGQVGANTEGSFFNRRLDEIAGNIQAASISQLKSNKERLENLREMAQQSLGGSEQGKGVYQQYVLLVSKLDEELKSRKKLGGQLSGFLARQGVNTLSVVDALTSKAPLVGLGIKFILDRGKEAKKTEDSNGKRAKLLDMIAYRDLLSQQKEKGFSVEGGRPSGRGPRAERAGRSNRERPEREPRKKKVKEEKTAPRNFNDTIDADFVDLGSVPYGEPKVPGQPEYAGPRLLNSVEDNREAEAERERNRPVDITPKDRLLREGQGNDFNWPPQTPKFLNAGKNRNRNAKGHFAPGMMEGNYVPKQKGVVPGAGGIPESPIENLNKTLSNLKIVAVNIRSDMGKFHTEEKTKTDSTKAAEEEKRINDEQHQEDLIKSIRLISEGKGSSKEKVKEETKKSGIAETIKSFLPSIFGGAGGAAATGAGAAATGAGVAGAAGAAAGGIGLGTAALGLGGAVATTLGTQWVAKKLSDKTLDVLGIKQPPFELYAEALADQGVKGMEKHWWLPDDIWKSKVWNAFKYVSKNNGGTGWYEYWLKGKHPDKASKSSTSTELPKAAAEKTGPEHATSPKMAGDVEKSAAFSAPGKTETASTGAASTYVPESKTTAPVMQPGSSASSPASAPVSTTPETKETPGAPAMVSQGGKMKLDAVGIKSLQSREGCKLTPYPDAAGHSIGYGHFIKPGEEELMKGISQSKADSLFKTDLAKYEKSVNDAVKVPISQEMFNELVDLAYNAGPGAVSSPAKLINKGNFAGAAKQIQDHYKTSYSTKTKKSEVNPELVKRREKETAAFSPAKVALLKGSGPTKGQEILSTTKQNEDKKSEQSKSSSNTILAPSHNTQVNNATTMAPQQDPRNRDNTYKDTRYRNSFST